MENQKTVILLHGFGEDSSIFRQQVDALKAKYNVYAPDLPGSGVLNDHHWITGTESIEWLAEWVKSFMESKGIDRCSMLGHSMGGYITLAFAEKYPQHLQAFGLIHSTAFADSISKKETREKAISFIQEKGGFSFLKTAIPGLFGEKFSKTHPGEIASLVSKAAHFRDHSLIAYYRAMINRKDRTSVLKTSVVPVLMVAGTEDIAAPLQDLLIQAAFPAICHFSILQETGHMGMLEESQKISEILLNFMDTL